MVRCSQILAVIITKSGWGFHLRLPSRSWGWNCKQWLLPAFQLWPTAQLTITGGGLSQELHKKISCTQKLKVSHAPFAFTICGIWGLICISQTYNHEIHEITLLWVWSVAAVTQVTLGCFLKLVNIKPSTISDKDICRQFTAVPALCMKTHLPFNSPIPHQGVCSVEPSRRNRTTVS